MMIKFFRQIRKSLLEQNQMGKYFKYAIGEILLVVIGILLALQINNWNVSRIETKQEIKILRELNSDLKSNLTEISGMIQQISSREKGANIILRYIEEQKEITDTLKLALEWIPIDGIFNNAQTAYKYIENQGINIITNDSLRIRITEIYEKDFVNITNREGTEKQIVLSELLPTITPLLKTTKSVWKSPNNDEGFFPTIPNEPISMKALNNNKFVNAIVHMRNWLTLRKIRLGETKMKLEFLIRDVNEEIKKLES